MIIPDMMVVRNNSQLDLLPFLYHIPPEVAWLVDISKYAKYGIPFTKNAQCSLN